jgi:hypothetical protein
MHWRTDQNHLFHAHPWHSSFSLFATFLLAGLVVLALVISAR